MLIAGEKMKKRILVMGEKPQGVTWLVHLIQSGLFEIVAGVPRKSLKGAWWDVEIFEEILTANYIPVIERGDIHNYEYDILWSLMYGFIVDSELIEQAECSLNLHESPLPKYRGCNGYTHAILNKDTTYGTTFHYLDSKLDHGQIIDQELFPLYAYETSKELYFRTMMISERMFKKNLLSVASGKINSIPNDTKNEPIRQRSSLVGLKQLDKQDNVNTIDDVFCYARAFDFLPFEPAYFNIEHSKIYVFLNNSLGRPNLRKTQFIDSPCSIHQILDMVLKKGVVCCNHTGRSLVFMVEKEYQKYFTVFSPEYSWLKE